MVGQGLNPKLRQGLLSSDNNNVKQGAAILDESSGLVADSARGCQDCFWAILFLATVGGVAALAVINAEAVLDAGAEFHDNYKEHAAAAVASSSASSSTSTGLYDPVEEGNLFVQAMAALGGAGLGALLTAILFLEVLKRFTECMVWTALLLSPCILIVMGLGCIGIGLSSDLGPACLMYGGVLLAIGFCLGSCVICCWRSMIPFTVLLIDTVVSVMQKHPSMIFISIYGSFMAVAWSLLVGFAAFALFILHRDQMAESSGMYDEPSRGDQPSAFYAVYFLVCLVYIWGGLVAANTASVACCGVFGRWYFGKDDAHCVFQSVKAAMTTSFGSICFGSFLVATVRALEMTVRAMRDQAMDDGNIVLVIIFSIIGCCLSCIGDIVEWFNEFAYVQCAVRGLSFMRSVRATYALCTFSNCTLICADSLVGSVCFLGALPPAVVGGAAAFGIVSMMKGHPHVAGMIAIVGSFIGLVVGVAAIRPLQSGSTTFVVCWAEEPQALARSHPKLARAFAERGSCWMEDIDYPDGQGLVVRPQGDARTMAVTAPMVQLQDYPASRQFAVIVPEGVQAGGAVQCNTPEGTLVQVQVPAGYSAGMQFMAQY